MAGNRKLLQFADLRSRWLAFGLLLTLALLLYIHTGLQGYHADDAYIHIRIAQNLDKTGEPYFNTGDPQKASSSTGWLLLLTGLLKASAFMGLKTPLPGLIIYVNAVFSWLGGMLFALVLRRVTKAQPSWLVSAIFFVAYLGLILQSSLDLMEIPVAMALVGLAFLLLLGQKPLSMMLFAAAVFFRPELIVVYGLLLGYVLIKRLFAVKEIAFYSIVGFAPFVIFDLFYYGKLIPNAVIAKSLVYEMNSADAVADLFCGVISCYEMNGWFGGLVALVLFLLTIVWFVWLSMLFAYKLLRKPLWNKEKIDLSSVLAKVEVSDLFFLWAALILAAYAYNAVLIFDWYIPLFSIPLIFGLLLFLMEKHPAGVRLVYSSLALPMFLVVILILPEAVSAASGNPAVYRDFAEQARVKKYIEVGEFLYDQYPAAVLLTSEIGGLGYGFNGTIIDAAGLVSPEALQYHPLSVPEERSNRAFGAIPIPFVESQMPDIVVSYDIFIEAFLESDAQRTYYHIRCPVFVDQDLALTDMRTIWDSDYLNIYIRRDLSPSPLLKGCELQDNF